MSEFVLSGAGVSANKQPGSMPLLCAYNAIEAWTLLIVTAALEELVCERRLVSQKVDSRRPVSPSCFRREVTRSPLRVV